MVQTREEFLAKKRAWAKAKRIERMQQESDAVRREKREWAKKKYHADIELARAKSREIQRRRDPKEKSERRKKWYVDNDATVNNMFYNARKRAKDLGIPFEITKEDLVVPSHCPVLGIPLIKNAGMGKDMDEQRDKQSSPSIDRVVPELGYVKENVVVISHRANMMKFNGTPEELQKVADYARIETARVKKALG